MAGVAVAKGSDESSSIPIELVRSAATQFKAVHSGVSYIATTDGPFEATLINVGSLATTV